MYTSFLLGKGSLSERAGLPPYIRQLADQWHHDVSSGKSLHRHAKPSTAPTTTRSTEAGCDRRSQRTTIGRSRGEQVAMWFDTSAFRESAGRSRERPFRFGTSGRHTVIGPGINNWDFAAYKDFPINERSAYPVPDRVFQHSESSDLLESWAHSRYAPIRAGSCVRPQTDSGEIQFALKLYF